ncbi:MAG TPA: HEAT repeat domain-containing protein, partial [Planctomycetota bacterium]|nr:HEAT repeat domain-containing protein [Planctomycetota bacterium]
MRLLTPLGLWTLAGLSGCGKEEPPSPPVAVKKPPAPKAPPAAPAAEPARKAPPDLMDPDPAIRQKAALSLGERSADAANVVPQLVERLHDPQEEVRLAAIDSLARLAPASVPALIDLLGHPKSELRQRAARALGKAGTPAAPAVPNLIAALPDADL